MLWGLTRRYYTCTRFCCSQPYVVSFDIQLALKVPLEKMLKLVRTRPTTQSHTLVKKRPMQPPLPNSCLGSDPGDGVAGPHLRRLWRGTLQHKLRRKRQALHRRLLKHRLLLAVIPWVGDINLSCTQAPKRPAAVQTQGTIQGSWDPSGAGAGTSPGSASSPGRGNHRGGTCGEADP